MTNEFTHDEHIFLAFIEGGKKYEGKIKKDVYDKILFPIFRDNLKPVDCPNFTLKESSQS